MTYHLEGLVFGKLTVTSATRNASGKLRWQCQCECGHTSKTATSYSLLAGSTTSCGRCYQKYNKGGTGRQPTITHGETVGGRLTPTFMSWHSMRARIRDRNKPTYFGMYIDPRWDADYLEFKRDMGERPPGKTLDRKDNAQGYFKDNCRWATPIEQSRNRRKPALMATVNGQTKYLSDWAAEMGVAYSALKARMRRTGSIVLSRSM